MATSALAKLRGDQLTEAAELLRKIRLTLLEPWQFLYGDYEFWGIWQLIYGDIYGYIYMDKIDILI